MPLLGGRPYPVGEIVDRTFDGPAGKLRVRVYQPAGAAAQPLRPSSITMAAAGSSAASKPTTRFAATSPPHRLRRGRGRLPAGAEHRFPAAIDDAVAAFRWLATEGPAMGIDPARIVVGGDSAGGTVAAAVAQQVRGDATPPCLQWLIYPVTDLAFEGRSFVTVGERFWSPGQPWNGCAPIISRTCTKSPIRGPSPLRAKDLAGLPPALVYTAGFDPLRDEGQAYADKMAAAGVKVSIASSSRLSTVRRHARCPSCRRTGDGRYGGGPAPRTRPAGAQIES